MFLQQLIVIVRTEIISAVTYFEIQFPRTRNLLSGFIPGILNKMHLVLFFPPLGCQDPVDCLSTDAIPVCLLCRSQWPHSVRCGSMAARLLGLRFRIPPGAWMSVSCECCEVEVSESGW